MHLIAHSQEQWEEHAFVFVSLFTKKPDHWTLLISDNFTITALLQSELERVALDHFGPVMPTWPGLSQRLMIQDEPSAAETATMFMKTPHGSIRPDKTLHPDEDIAVGLSRPAL